METEICPILPEGYKMCQDIKDIMSLKKGIRKSKKKPPMFPEDYSINAGKTIYIRSHILKCYYKRELEDIFSISKLQEYIKLKLIYYRP